jgi:hypothetical protein
VALRQGCHPTWCWHSSHSEVRCQVFSACDWNMHGMHPYTRTFSLNDIAHHSTLCLLLAGRLCNDYSCSTLQWPLGFNSTHWIYYFLFYTSYLKIVLDMTSFCLPRSVISNTLIHCFSEFCCWHKNIKFLLLSFKVSLVQALLIFILNEDTKIPG